MLVTFRSGLTSKSAAACLGRIARQCQQSVEGECTPRSYVCPLRQPMNGPLTLPSPSRGEGKSCIPTTVFLRREAVAAPEDVGGEGGERDHEGDPDTVGTRQDGQVDAGIDDAEA